MIGTPTLAEGLTRRLGLTTATALIVGEVIGVGIFLTPAAMAKSLGSPFWMLVVWVTMGASAIGGALCFGALSTRYPEAGGPYVYLREAYGARVAFLYGWISLLVTDPGITASVAVGLARYVGYLGPLSAWGQKGVAVAAIAGPGGGQHAGSFTRCRRLASTRRAQAWLARFPRALGFRFRARRLGESFPFLDTEARLRPTAAGARRRAHLRVHFVRRVVGREQARRRDARSQAHLAEGPGAGRVDRDDRLHRRQRGVSLPGTVIENRVGRRRSLPWRARRFSDRQAARSLPRSSSSRSREACRRCSWRRPGFITPWHAMVCSSRHSRRSIPSRGTPARAVALQAALAMLLAMTGTYEEILAFLMVPTLVLLVMTVCGVFVLRRSSPAPGPGRDTGVSAVSTRIRRSDPGLGGHADRAQPDCARRRAARRSGGYTGRTWVVGHKRPKAPHG